MGINSSRWDYERKQQALAFIVLIGMVVGEFLFMFLYIALTTRLNNGLITTDQFDAAQGKISVILIAYIVILFIVIIFMGVWMKIADVEYKKEQIAYDSFQMVIELDEFDEATYLVQTKSDSTTEIDTTEQMIELLKNSETYQSIVKSIESGVETFDFDQANFLKQKLNQDVKEIQIKKEKEKEKEKEMERQSVPVPKKSSKKSRKNRKKTNDDFVEDEEPEKEIVISFADQQRYIDLLGKLSIILPIVQTEKLFLYYRPIETIRRIDDPEIDPEDEDDLKHDRLSGITGMIYLLEDEEKTVFKHRPRLSLYEAETELRKAYIHVKLVSFTTLNTAFFIDQRLLARKKSKRKSLADSSIKALGFLTHLALDRDEELRDEIEDHRIDIINLNRELDKKRDSELQKLLHSGELENAWRNKFDFPKLNGTAIIFSISCFIIGLFVGMGFV